MKKKYSLILGEDFIQYCELNNINNIDEFAKETFQKGFLQIKYGWNPKIDSDKVIDRPPVMIKEIKSSPEPQKETITDTQIENKVDVSTHQKNITSHPKKDLYDE